MPNTPWIGFQAVVECRPHNLHKLTTPLLCCSPRQCSRSGRVPAAPASPGPEDAGPPETPPATPAAAAEAAQPGAPAAAQDGVPTQVGWAWQDLTYSVGCVRLHFLPQAVALPGDTQCHSNFVLRMFAANTTGAATRAAGRLPCSDGVRAGQEPPLPSRPLPPRQVMHHLACTVVMSNRKQPKIARPWVSLFFEPLPMLSVPPLSTCIFRLPDLHLLHQQVIRGGVRHGGGAGRDAAAVHAQPRRVRHQHGGDFGRRRRQGGKLSRRMLWYRS